MGSVGLDRTIASVVEIWNEILTAIGALVTRTFRSEDKKYFAIPSVREYTKDRLCLQEESSAPFSSTLCSPDHSPIHSLIDMVKGVQGLLLVPSL